MSRYRNALIISIAAVAITAAVAWAQTAPPEQVEIEKCGETKGQVTFDHAAHLTRAENCATCHHTQEDLTAESGTGESCRSCHLTPETEGQPGCTDRSPRDNAYHGRCMGCHREASREEGVEAPVRCAGCHGEDPE